MMKKFLVAMLVLAGLATTQFLSAAAPTQESADGQEEVSLSDLENVWMTKSIPVEGGGAAPDVVKLFLAVGRQWPCIAAPSVASQKKVVEVVKDSESDMEYTHTVDRKNGYICLDGGGGDGEYISACVYRRANGHRLFIVNPGQPTDPEIDFLCLYDYDPTTETLTPDVEMMKLTADCGGFGPYADDHFHYYPFYRLPQYGKRLTVQVGSSTDSPEVVFDFDGQNLVLQGTKFPQELMENCLKELDLSAMPEEFPPFTQYALTDIDHDGTPEFWLSNGESHYAFHLLDDYQPLFLFSESGNGERHFSRDNTEAFGTEIHLEHEWHKLLK